MTSRNRDSGIGRWMWDRWIGVLLRGYPRRFRDRFGDDLRAQFRHTTPSFTAAIAALKDLGRAGLGARLDDAPPKTLQGAMAAMGIDHLTPVPVRMLSTGQRKRAILARTIASGAGIWLLDEPANGLDSAALDRLAAAMTAHRAGGGIVVAATHQPIGLIDPIEVAL